MAKLQFLPLLFCIVLEAISAVDVHPDAIVLLQLKSAVESDPWNLLADWDPSVKPHCSWRGVACDGVSGRVVSLSLTASGLSGGLSPSVGNLSALRTLSLAQNRFFGEIPEEIGRLLLLDTLELQANNFSGRVPPQIAGIPSLRSVNLSRNSLSGPIPEALFGSSVIESVDLSYNLLSDGVRIGRCGSLAHLRLSSNFLVGKIPPEIGNCSNLQSLELDGNIIEGRIPPEVGLLPELRILDVSRNSLTGRIPKELASCTKLSVLVLTNLVEFDSSDGSSVNARGEFNAFMGGIPFEILWMPALQLLWAPRANLNGPLPQNWNERCGLRALNLGQNYVDGVIPEGLGMCRSLSFLDLSSNDLKGSIPAQLPVSCMEYLNVSGNSLSGSLLEFSNASCTSSGSLFGDANLAPLLSSSRMNNPFMSISDLGFSVLHDFSWNSFTGPLPSFSLGDGFFSSSGSKSSYGLLLNNNFFNGSIPVELFTDCNRVESFAVNLSANQISGGMNGRSIFSCSKLKSFQAADNRLSGPFPSGIGNLRTISCLDLRRNNLSGALPEPLTGLKNLKWLLLGENQFTGEIPAEVGRLASLLVLDLSRNALTSEIPASLANAAGIEIMLLDHNKLSGEIPSSFSNLSKLVMLDVSFNNLSGRIPQLEHSGDCDSFKENSFLQKCPDLSPALPSKLPSQSQSRRWGGRNSKLKSFVIALVASACVIVSVLVALVLVLVFGRKKLGRLAGLRRKVVVTFTHAPAELIYDNVIRATGNFSITNLIGAGGFGATYQAELVPGFLVAVKRLSMGRFQGLKQFDAEIRTLGRIRHKNLVTLIGYHMGENETFLIYNYLSGGNLETFIHEGSDGNMRWPVIHKIALDVAHALAYLHYSCVPRIVHRDIKPSNILLDESLNAYLSDFGLARLLEVSVTHATTDVAGTFGYVAPEYATTCRVSDKSDVYSFGVVLLEMISGKRSLDPSFSEYGNGFNIVAWGKMLIKEGRPSELFPPAMWEAGPQDSMVGMLKLALACTFESLAVRPSMKQVVDKLKQLSSS
ncbi:hypothetical protein ACLOJK_025790 [Asimina triloba]